MINTKSFSVNIVIPTNDLRNVFFLSTAYAHDGVWYCLPLQCLTLIDYFQKNIGKQIAVKPVHELTGTRTSNSAYVLDLISTGMFMTHIGCLSVCVFMPVICLLLLYKLTVCFFYCLLQADTRQCTELFHTRMAKRLPRLVYFMIILWNTQSQISKR